MCRWIGAWLVLAALGCAAVEVTTEVAPGVDFSRFETYALLPPSGGDPQVRDAVARALEKQLAARGFRAADLARADLSVDFRASATPVAEARDIGFPGDATIVIEHEIESTLTIDVREARSGNRIWRGTGQVDIGRARGVEQAANEAVEAVLADFPPEPRSAPGADR